MIFNPASSIPSPSTPPTPFFFTLWPLNAYPHTHTLPDLRLGLHTMGLQCSLSWEGEAWGEERLLNHDLAARPMCPSPNPPRLTGQSCSAAAVLPLLALTQREVWGPHVLGAEEPPWLGKEVVRASLWRGGREGKCADSLIPLTTLSLPPPACGFAALPVTEKALRGAAAQPCLPFPRPALRCWTLTKLSLYCPSPQGCLRYVYVPDKTAPHFGLRHWQTILGSV